MVVVAVVVTAFTAVFVVLFVYSSDIIIRNFQLFALLRLSNIQLHTVSLSLIFHGHRTKHLNRAYFFIAL